MLVLQLVGRDGLSETANSLCDEDAEEAKDAEAQTRRGAKSRALSAEAASS